MELIVIRHGESQVNVHGNQVPNMDASLTEHGLQQAEALRDWLMANEHRADVLYTSTMQRALETTAIIAEALQQPAHQDHRIREIPSVYPSGQAIPPNELPRQYVSRWVNKAPFEPRAVDVTGTESWMHFRTRVGQFTDDLIDKHEGQRVYVVAHGGVISAIFDNIFNVGPYRQADVHNTNTSWSRFEYFSQQTEAWLVWDHNRVDHLREAGLL